MDARAPGPVARRSSRGRGLAGLVVLLTLTGLTASCGGDDDSPESPPASDTGPVVIDVTIADGKVTPAGEQVEAKVGQQVQVHVDSDAPDELHVHSNPEHEFVIKPKDDQLFSFSVDQPGQIEIETHETETVVAELVVS